MPEDVFYNTILPILFFIGLPAGVLSLQYLGIDNKNPAASMFTKNYFVNLSQINVATFLSFFYLFSLIKKEAFNEN